MTPFKLIISCGGTGGHFYPGLSIARDLVTEGREVRLFLGGHHAEKQTKIAEDCEISADPAYAVRMPRGIIQLIFFPFLMALAVIKSFFYLGRHKPDAILCMGSFAGVPIGIAAKIRGVPIFLHEGNTFVGKANRLLSRWAKVLYLSFPVKNESAVQCETEITGMPLRPELLQKAEETDKNWKAHFGLNDDPVILVFGGSQGALKINNAFKESVTNLPKPFQIIQLTGLTAPEEYEAFYQENKITAVVKRSYEDIGEIFHAADLAVCRAGASSLAEMAVYKTPAIFIPLAIAADGHQQTNAELASEIDGGLIITEAELSEKKLTEEISGLLNNLKKREEMAANISKLAKPQAAHAVINGIMEKTGKKNVAGS